MRLRMPRTPWGRAAVGGAAATILAATAGFAFWAASGAGDGDVTTASSVMPVVVNLSSIPSSLSPGGEVALEGSFDNPNSGPVNLQTITGTVTGTGNPGCAAADFHVTGTGVVGGGSVPAGNGVGSWDGLSLAMDNTAVDQSACINTAIHLHFVAS